MRAACVRVDWRMNVGDIVTTRGRDVMTDTGKKSEVRLKPARDYEADQRPAPPPPDASEIALWDRGHQFVKSVLAGAGARKPQPGK